ncbi:MGH1-like glycoside hydrolase domain-containing protein [Paludisphaera rhizosphaerae]|uniref:MGH1-like glycoside hydrolase domain-containing protein n=1 Tax=Paludisphaera rhizosphaerae TaxID=2711216 RepID=UPI0013EAC083|nr:glucosidase [Paludisphaera rhizosphaerae]
MADERGRLAEYESEAGPWKLWGPYLSERQWSTVREDYSADGNNWTSFPHEHARSRAYRWGEDGLLGLADRECRLGFAVALWNGRDPILKERLFGLANPQGNHGEDVKELYYFLDALPTAAYLKALYKYPQSAFPYDDLVAENGRRGFHEPEYEILDTGVFDEDRYFDVLIEYAKAAPDDVLIRVTASNRGSDPAPLVLLPTLWFRNTWSWGGGYEHEWGEPKIRRDGAGVLAEHATLGPYRLDALDAGEWVFTNNETNFDRLFGGENARSHVKDGFHDYVIDGESEAVGRESGTKAGAVYRMELAPGESRSILLRLRSVESLEGEPFGKDFDEIFSTRLVEADAFHGSLAPGLSPERAAVMRQANAGLIWNQQFFYYHVPEWVAGDPAQPAPPAHRTHPNHDWRHLHARDILSMPDVWEFPWFAVWDTAFHMIPHGDMDPAFAKDQMLRFLREWYMHPNGQLPAYEFNFADVNPPVHAWACRRIYERSGKTDKRFLARVFQKLALNFTWWVNRKDFTGRHLFSGGFLGLDNIGVFDRSSPLPTGGHLEQADGTAWMAFFCVEMLEIALELAADDPAYEDMASKFFEHYLAITSAINTIDGTGLWDEADGFYYDHLHLDGKMKPLHVRSMVGLIPLFAVGLLSQERLDALPNFRRRVEWVARHMPRASAHLELPGARPDAGDDFYLLSIPSQDRLKRLMTYVLDEAEFLSPYGVRSLSRVHAEKPFVIHAGGGEHRVEYVPAEADGGLFGGNSNWRGPVWFPLNFLLVESLERYGAFYGDACKVECPTGSGNFVTLTEAADEIARRLTRIFLPDAQGNRPCHGGDPRYADDPHWKDLVLFYEFFHGDTGRGCGANHQTGWTALAATLLRDRHGA